MNFDPLDLQLAANLRGDFEEGWKYSQLLERARPGDNRAAFNRGWHLMQQGDLLKGFELIDRGRIEEVFGSKPITGEQWNGKDSLMGKTLLLRGEGGFGDEIINVRFAKNFAQLGANVIVACQPQLISLFKRVEGVFEVISHSDIPQAHYHYWVPAMSAARWLGLSYQTLSGEAYINPKPDAVEAWKNLLNAPDLKVGIRWSGNPRFEHEQHRRFPAEPLIALSQIPNVQIYSLQRDTDLRDLPNAVGDLQSLLLTFEDTAAAIASLDLVITSCTVTAHLSAAMGKETWVILPILPYYLWALPGEKSPWYNSVRLFRQEAYGEWELPLAAVRAGVEKKAASYKSMEEQIPKPAIPAAQTDTPKPLKPFLPQGLFLAPKPEHSSAGKNKSMHFVAGLPRTGATVLMSLLAQNPRIFSAPISGLGAIFSGIFGNWEKGERHREMPNQDAKKRVLKAVMETYHETERPIILDKDRMWVLHLARIEEILERPAKVIVTVRALPEILASFEVLRRKHPMELTAVDEALGGNSTAASRAAFYASDSGVLGGSYNALKDAVTSGYLDRMLFVDYNKLITAPKTQLKRIYEFLEEPYFEHDLSAIKQVSSGKLEGFPGLHDIRSELKKTAPSAREILGAEVYGQYDQPEPWSLWT